MTDCLFEVQKAVFTALDGDSTLGSLTTGIYTHVSQNTVFPYVTIGEMEAEDLSSDQKNGFSIKMKINIFSQQRGSKEALNIMAEIKRILHDSNPSISGGVVVMMRNVGTRVQPIEGVTWQGEMTFLTLIELS